MTRWFPVLTLVYYDQTVRKLDSYAAVEHPLRLALRASDSRRAEQVITSPLLKRWVPTTWHFPIAICLLLPEFSLPFPGGAGSVHFFVPPS